MTQGDKKLEDAAKALGVNKHEAAAMLGNIKAESAESHQGKGRGIVELPVRDEAAWAAGWIAGAVAMAKLLTNGSREEWERDRDEFFAKHMLNENFNE